ncbi:magnesium transporter CorA family protein [bacterium]|nr:magnesium transporter CorA family protein [bacterium]
MLEIFRTDDQKISKIEEIIKGAWIKLVSPSAEEIEKIATSLTIDKEDIQAATDPEEKNRIEIEDSYTLILIDIPTQEIRHREARYTTIPLGIILTQDNIITICSEDTEVLKPFHEGRMRNFSTKKKLKFVYQIIARATKIYQQVLITIDSKRTEFENQIENINNEKELISIHELESTLVYFSTSLRGNGNVLNRLTRYKDGRLQRYPEDQELLEDVIVENQQAIEMAQIYREIINGTRDLMSSIMDSRLNNTMKRLTSITIVCSIPTIISGIYGMNVDGRWMPLAQTTHGFMIICMIILLLCILLSIIFKFKNML